MKHKTHDISPFCFDLQTYFTTQWYVSGPGWLIKTLSTKSPLQPLEVYNTYSVTPSIVSYRNSQISFLNFQNWARNHPFAYNAHPLTANLVRDDLQRFSLETLQHPPYSPELSPVTSIFLAIWRRTFVDVCFIWTRKCKSGQGCASNSDLPFPTKLELIVLSPNEKCINTSGNYFWIKQIPLSLCSECLVFISLPLVVHGYKRPNIQLQADDHKT